MLNRTVPYLRRMFLLASILLLANANLQTESIGQDKKNSITLRFGGDVLLAARYEEGVGEDIHRAFRDFSLLRDADLSMVNLECPVTTRGDRQEKPFTFRMNPRFLDVIKEAGIDLVTIANNHIYDYGKVGLFDTIEHLDSAGIPFVGGGRTNVEAHRPFIKSFGERQVAFLGYYGGGEAPAASGSKAGVARRDLGVISSDIRKLKRDNAGTYIVVNVHWGTEKAEHPDKAQVAFARALIDAGADAIIGHHPHVLQGVELYKHGVIAYSLGNFVFGGNSRHTYDTAIFEIRLSQGSTDYALLPVRIENWNARSLDGDEAKRVVHHVKNLSRGFPRTIFEREEKK